MIWPAIGSLPKLAQQDVSARWQDATAHLLEERVPDSGQPALDEVFVRLD